MNRLKILAINPGSTSTKIAGFENHAELFSTTIDHLASELEVFSEVQDQLQYREDTIVFAVEKLGYSVADFDVYVGRGGGQVPLMGGVYVIDEKLVEHARIGMAGQHPAQLASQICFHFKTRFNKRAYVVNPPDVDEFQLLSRITGLKDVYRSSNIHALNQKEIAARYAQQNKTNYRDLNLIVCHLGGGISVTAHQKGKMIDSNSIIRGEGPMTPTRAGSLPTIALLDLAFSGQYTKKELYDKLTKNGGVIDHLGTSDLRSVETMIAQGDVYAGIVFDAMVYQIAKYVGQMAVVLKGEVDQIILTGGIANSRKLVDELSHYLNWISPLTVMAGEFEMQALCTGVLRVVAGEEDALRYSGIPVWQGFQD